MYRCPKLPQDFLQHAHAYIFQGKAGRQAFVSAKGPAYYKLDYKSKPSQLYFLRNYFPSYAQTNPDIGMIKTLLFFLF